MTETRDAAEVANEAAYYYPEPYWLVGEVDPLKTLLLFFDEIAILLPRYMHGRETANRPLRGAVAKPDGMGC